MIKIVVITVLLIVFQTAVVFCFRNRLTAILQFYVRNNCTFEKKKLPKSQKKDRSTNLIKFAVQNNVVLY